MVSYFDPARPLLGNGQPQALWGSALPRWSVEPLDDTACEVTVWLPALEGFAPFRCQIVTDNLGLYFSQYCQDPEIFLQQHFNYFPPTKRTPATTISLEDLGL